MKTRTHLPQNACTLPAPGTTKNVKNTQRYTNAAPADGTAKCKGHAIINVTDLWWKDNNCGKRLPVHIFVVEEMQKAGYELRNTIIWDRRNLVNKVGIFGWPSNYITLGTTFEYILDFWKL
jgi:hypothetical protein